MNFRNLILMTILCLTPFGAMADPNHCVLANTPAATFTTNPSKTSYMTRLALLGALPSTKFLAPCFKEWNSGITPQLDVSFVTWEPPRW